MKQGILLLCFAQAVLCAFLENGRNEIGGILSVSLQDNGYWGQAEGDYAYHFGNYFFAGPTVSYTIINGVYETTGLLNLGIGLPAGNAYPYLSSGFGYAGSFWVSKMLVPLTLGVKTRIVRNLFLDTRIRYGYLVPRSKHQLHFGFGLMGLL